MTTDGSRGTWRSGPIFDFAVLEVRCNMPQEVDVDDIQTMSEPDMVEEIIRLRMMVEQLKVSQLTQLVGPIRRPHRCPICLGSGQAPTNLGCTAAWSPCHPCGGSGVLWG